MAIKLVPRSVLAIAIMALVALAVRPSPLGAQGSGSSDVSVSAASSWGKRFNPSAKVPADGFKAVYFDRSQLDRPPIIEPSKSIAIKYAWADFHKIKSEDFAAYWVGRLSIDKPVTKQISVSQSRAKSRIWIDGKVVYEGDNNKSFVHQFDIGAHVIEVEYINSWHTVNFKVTIDDAFTLSEPEGILRSILSMNLGADVRLHYVGLYESGAADSAVDVILPEGAGPTVLYLGSYHAVDWRILSTGNVKAVILASFHPGSRAIGVTPGSVLRSKKVIYQSSEIARCGCRGSHFHCEENADIEDVAKELQSLTGLTLVGYGMNYSASSMALKPYDRTVTARVIEARRENEKAKKACSVKVNPDFDTMLKK